MLSSLSLWVLSSICLVNLLCCVQQDTLLQLKGQIWVADLNFRYGEVVPNKSNATKSLFDSQKKKD